MKLEQLIKENKIDEALDFIQSNNEMSPAIKVYNEAFIHFKKNDLIKARVLLEKSQKMGLYSQETSDALKVIKRSLGVESIENSYYKEDSFIFSTLGFNQDVYYSLIGILLLFSLIFFSKTKKLAGLISLIFCVGLGSFFYITHDHNVKINTEESVVYSGPSKIFDEVQIILPGMKVITTIQAGDWSFIKYPEVYRGWVLNHKAEKL